MSNTFTDQVAVITGGASGLGLAIAKKLVEGSARVALLDLSEDSLVTAAGQVGRDVSIFSCNVIDELQVNGVIERIADQFGRIDILVNSAGVTGKTNLKS